MKSRYLISAIVILSAPWLSHRWVSAEPLETRESFLGNIAEITIEDPRRPDGSQRPIIDGDLLISPLDASAIPAGKIKEALTLYIVVSPEQWAHPWAHIIGGDPHRAWTGQVVMKDGHRVRWLMPQDGLLSLRYPDGRWLYLLADEITPRPHQEQPWQPVAQPRNPSLAPTAVDRCVVDAASQAEVEACMTKWLLGVTGGKKSNESGR